MTANRQPRGVSVCIPTYKRPQTLRRAVESVLAQTYQDWELAISDDEDPPGETWQYLLKLAQQDSRIVVLRNLGPHGQVPNTNQAMLKSRGTWIKLLHDDDVLLPGCLETLLSVVNGLPSVVMASCLSLEYFDNRPVRGWRRRGSASLELIAQKHVHLGMYLQDCNVGAPTQLMVRHEAIEQGALFEEVPGVVSSVDVIWECNVLRHGDLLFVDRALVEHHQDGQSVTTGLTAEQLEAEYPIVLKKELECIDPSQNPPPLPVVLQMVKCIRALHRLKSRKVGQALGMFSQVRRPAAWMLAARWLVNQTFPGRFHMIPRVRLETPEGWLRPDVQRGAGRSDRCGEEQAAGEPAKPSL